MKTAIRLLAIGDLVLFLPAPVFLALYLVLPQYIGPLSSCTGPGNCDNPVLVAIILFILPAVGILLSLVVVTLSIVEVSRRGLRGWFTVFLILTGLLVLGPALIVAGVLYTYQYEGLGTLSLVAIAASLVAFVQASARG
jgi:hypothetical protein